MLTPWVLASVLTGALQVPNSVTVTVTGSGSIPRLLISSSRIARGAAVANPRKAETKIVERMVAIAIGDPRTNGNNKN